MTGDMLNTLSYGKSMRSMILMVLLFVQLPLMTAFAQTDDMRRFTKQTPLVYEDVWDLWPYSFLNDNGEPDGFNVDLIRLIMKELDIPYIIRLKPSSEAFSDLKNGKSDLMLALAVGFHDEFGLYSKNAVTLFTQSVATPKSKKVEIKVFRDLGKPGLKVIVNDSSLCHHLMIDYGWGDNALPDKDICEAIQRVSAKGEGQIVWNTLSLKWLINRYHIDNLELTPVNMPHGEYKFMSNNQQLLDLLDEAYTRLYTNDQIQPLQDKWFYPERQQVEEPKELWYLTGCGLLLLVFIAVYGISYRIQDKKLSRENIKRNNRLALILQTSQVHIWTYDIKKNQFSWHNDNGQVAYTYTMEEFSHRYSREDFLRLKSALDKLAASRKTDGEEKEIELNLRAKDVERLSTDTSAGMGGDTNDRDYHIMLSILSRDKKGLPTVIIGTKKDVTEENRQRRLDEERTLRYWSIFYNPILGIILFNKEGRLVNINPKACDIFGCNADEAEEEGISIRTLFNIGSQELEKVDGLQATQAVGHDKITEYRLMTIHDDAGMMLGIYAFCRDITMSVSNKEQEQAILTQIEELRNQQRQYTDIINATISNTDIRKVTYSPQSHTLTIYRGTDTIQHALTQTRCMTLVDEQSQRKAMRLLDDMDNYANKVIALDIRTSLRAAGGHPLTLHFRMEPCHDKKGKVTAYRGMLRDISNTVQRAAKGLLPLFFFTLFTLLSSSADAQQLADTYTSQRPVVIVCDWDKAPYEFLNDKGLPSGSNIDVMQAVMDELHLPCRFVMKDWSIALKTFERGDADIILANARRYRRDPYVLSDNIVNYNRIRVAMHSDSVGMVSLNLLEREGAVFKPGDYSAFYFMDGDTMRNSRMEFQTPKVALMGLLNNDYKYYVWGEEPLKWKIKELNLEGIVLNDVGIPISEIHIIGRDRQLIEQIDDQYSRLKQSGEIAAIQDRWFHPERVHDNTSPMAYYVIIAVLLLTALCYLFARLAKAHVRSAARRSTELNGMMYKALHMGNFNIMVYDIKHDHMTNSYGQILPREGLTLEQFTRHIHPTQRQEFTQKMKRLTDGRERQFVLNKLFNSGTDEAPHWLSFHGHAILELDNEGHPAYVVNAIHDVTPDIEANKAERELVKKYEQLSNIPFVAMSFYDKDGWLIDLNDNMRQLCGMTEGHPANKRFWETVCMFDVPLFRNIYSPNSRNDMLVCQHMEYPEMGIDHYIEFYILPLFDNEGETCNYFITALDVTDDRNRDHAYHQHQKELQALQADISHKQKDLAFLLEHSGRRLEQGADGQLHIVDATI